MPKPTTIAAYKHTNTRAHIPTEELRRLIADQPGCDACRFSGDHTLHRRPI